MDLTKFARLGAIVGPLILGLILFFWPFFQTLIPGLTLLQIVGISMTVLTGLAFYFDRRFNDVLDHPSLATLTLADAIGRAVKKKKISNLRIFASTTGKIQPILSSLDILVDECEMILWKIRGDELINTEKRHNHRLNDLLKEWREVTTKKLRMEPPIVKVYDFCPTQYLIIIDRSFAVIGSFVPNPSSETLLEIEDPILVTSRTIFGRALIDKKIQWFEKLSKSSAVSDYSE